MDLHKSVVEDFQSRDLANRMELVWFNCYQCGLGAWHFSRERADRAATQNPSTREACINLRITWTVGEGLNFAEDPQPEEPHA